MDSLPVKLCKKANHTNKQFTAELIRKRTNQMKKPGDSEKLLEETSSPQKQPSSLDYELITYHQLPQWAQDNEFIQKYYRKSNTNWQHILISSFFQFHNETYNIYSHLIPAVLAILIANHFIFLPSSSFTNDSLEKSVWIGYLCCAAIMLTCSWTFHASYCHSYKTFCIASKLDYAGISFMIIGSFLPWLFYTFYCEKFLFRFYFGSILLLGAICIYFSLSEKFAQPEYRTIRASLFVGMGLFAVVPVIHMGLKIGFMELFVKYYLWTLLTMAACYIGGAVIP